MAEPLTLALPKGRLLEQTQEFFAAKGIRFSVQDRKLTATDADNLVTILMVKNSDLPTYVHHGIAGLGICGEDVIYESAWPFFYLRGFDFGGTRMCLACKQDYNREADTFPLRVATKFTRFTRDYFHERGIPVEIIKLNGSVELAPVLGLAPYIADLVETGSTLKANKLHVVEELASIKVQMIANQAYYKVHYRQIESFLARLV